MSLGSNAWRLGRRMVIALLAVVLLASMVLLIGSVATILSPGQKEKLSLLQVRQKEFDRSLDVSVLDAGYRKSQVGSQELYIPALVVCVTNLTKDHTKKMVVMARFEMNRRDWCWASAPLGRFGPGEERMVILECRETVLFGTVVKGLSLIQTSGERPYSVWVQAGGLATSRVRGTLRYRVLDL